jgi:hypothetical protein
MPHKSDSSSTHSSSNDLSAHDEGVSQPLQEAPLPTNQKQVMDDFMVEWFGLDIVDDMFGNPHDEGANADDPRHQHTAQGQRQWQKAKTCSNTYFSRCKVKLFSSHTGVVKHPSKTQGKQYYVVRHFLVLS